MKKKYFIIVGILISILIIKIFDFEYDHKFTETAGSFKTVEYKKNNSSNNVYTQKIISKKNNLNNIRLYLNLNSNYGNLEQLTINLKLTLKDTKNNIIDQYKYKTAIFNEKSKYIDFKFDKIKDSNNKVYYLEIEPFNDANHNNINLEKMLIGYSTMYHSNRKLTIFIGSCILLILLLSMIILYYLNHPYMKIENKYLTISLICGILLIITIPIYKGNDEMSHFVRIYELSNKTLITKSIDGWPKTKVPLEFYKGFSKYSEIKKSINLKSDKFTYYDMEYSAVYPALAYIPSIISMSVAKLFIKNIFWWPYLIRLTQLLCSVAIIYMAIKIVPYGKKNVLIIGLIPTVMKQISLISADSTLISCSIFFICYLLYINEKEKINKKDTIILNILSIIMSISKLVYFPLCLLFLILTNKIPWKQKKKCFIPMIILSLFFIVLWNYFSLESLTSGQGVNTINYIKYYLKYPFNFILINFNNIFKMGFKYINEIFSGENSPYKLITPGLYSIIFIILYYENAINIKKISKKEKRLIGIVMLLTCLFINSSLLVTCTPMYTNYIVGIQGRYFSPLLLPLVFIIGRELKKDNFITKYYDLIIVVTYFVYILDIVSKYL